MNDPSINACRIVSAREFLTAELCRVFNAPSAARCKACDRAICGCSDAAYAGVVPNSPGVSGSGRADGPYNGQPAREREHRPGAPAGGHSAVKVGNGAPHISDLSGMSQAEAEARGFA